MRVEAFTDVDWVSYVDDKRSNSSYYTFVGGNLVIWYNKKQTVATCSSVKAEFRVIAHGIYEMLWIHGLLRELEFNTQGPMRMDCDNKATK